MAAPERPGIPDQQVGERIKELVAGKRLERLFSRKNEHDAAVAAYTANRFQPLWLANGSMNERARAAINHLRGIEADGLDPTDYPTPSFNATDAAGLAESDIKMTATLLTYARHVFTGRVHFTRISPNIDYKDQFDASDVMKQLASSNNIERTLDSFNPQQPAYKALKAKYAELRRSADHEIRIPTGPVLRVGLVDKKGKEAFMTDQRVPMVREKLGLPAGDDRYDRSVAEAVAKFQKSQDLKADGQLTAVTIDALNGPSRQKKIDAILATMERWRWMPRNLGPAHVVLNIPDYHLRVYKDGHQIWMTRVVVGLPAKATPVLTETMKYITVNPTWNVPPWRGRPDRDRNRHARQIPVHRAQEHEAALAARGNPDALDGDGAQPRSRRGDEDRRARDDRVHNGALSQALPRGSLYDRLGGGRFAPPAARSRRGNG